MTRRASYQRVKMNEAIAGLSSHELGATAAERRRRLVRLPDAALEARLVNLARRARAIDASPIVKAARLPLGEVVASPFALRAVAMGVAVGASARHRELRRAIDWTETTDVDPVVRDPMHDVWDGGALRTGKYQGFTAEDPFAIYDPSYVSKWGPHEMMHKAAGFFWRPSMTRWELYLGARLNELVPVVLFYGPEQIMRLDEQGFDRRAAGDRPSAAVGDARWLTDDEPALRASARRGIPILRDSIAWFERELATIDEELATGVRTRAAHPFLDTSSDASAYVVGHFARLGQAAVCRALAGAPGRTGDIDAYRERVEVLFDWLLFNDVGVDFERVELRRRERERFDLVYRAAHLGEGVEEDLAPLFDEEDPEVVRAELPARVGEEGAALVLVDGSERGRDVEQLAIGLHAVLPCTLAQLGEDVIAQLAASDALWDRFPLSARALSFLEGFAPAAVLAVARLEDAIARARRDDAVERLCVPAAELPADLSGGEIIASRHVQRLDLEYDALSAHMAFAEGELAPIAENVQTLLVAAFEDSVSVVPVSPELADAVMEARVSIRAAELDPEWMRELVGAGILGWRPGFEPSP